jgi:hypothetical protein
MNRQDRISSSLPSSSALSACSARGILLLFVVLLAGPARADEAVLRFLPSDTRLVLTVRVPLLGEAERKQGLEAVQKLYLGQLAPELKQADKELPIRDVTSIVIAQPHAGTLGGVIVMRGKVDGKMLDRQLGAARKASKGQLTVEAVGRPAVRVWRRRLSEAQMVELFPLLDTIPPVARKLLAPQNVYVAALDERTLLVTTTGTNMLRAVRSRPATTRPRTSTELTALLRKQDPKELASFVMMDDALFPAIALIVDESTRETFEQFEHLTVGVRPGKTVQVTLTAKGKSTEQGEALAKKAEQTLAGIRKGLPQGVKNEGQRKALDELFRSFKVSRKDAVVTLTGQIGEADVQKLLRRAEAQKKP